MLKDVGVRRIRVIGGGIAHPIRNMLNVTVSFKEFGTSVARALMRYRIQVP
jgi:hypothetical protein